MPAKRITFAIAALVLSAQLQCVAACADECPLHRAASTSVPPCHQHQEHSRNEPSKGCTFHSLVSSAISPGAPLLELPIVAVLDSAALISADRPVNAHVSLLGTLDESPPGAAGAHSSILRI